MRVFKITQFWVKPRLGLTNFEYASYFQAKLAQSSPKLNKITLFKILAFQPHSKLAVDCILANSVITFLRKFQQKTMLSPKDLIQKNYSLNLSYKFFTWSCITLLLCRLALMSSCVLETSLPAMSGCAAFSSRFWRSDNLWVNSASMSMMSSICDVKWYIWKRFFKVMSHPLLFRDLENNDRGRLISIHKKKTFD